MKILNPVNSQGNNVERLWRVMAVTCIALTGLYVSIVQLSGVDFWLQAKIGEMVVRDGAIPDTLKFPFTEIAAQKFNAHEWLSSILFHYGLKTLGEVGMPFVTGLAGLTYLYLATKLAYFRSGRNSAAALIFGMVALSTENYRHVLRPELISLLLMGFFWILLDQLRVKFYWKHAALSIIVVVLWANSHGSFVLAPVMTGIYATGMYLDTIIRKCTQTEGNKRISYQYLFLSVVHLIACLLNPFGVELLEFVFGFSNSEELSTVISEWMPTLDRRWFGLRGFWIAWVVWIGTAFVLLKNFRRLSSVDALFFVFFTILAIKAIRFPVYLGLMSAAVCAPYIAQSWSRRECQTTIYQIAIFISVTIGVTSLFFGNAQKVHPYSAGFLKLSEPVVRELKNPIHQGNVFTSLELGAELIYLAYPRLQPSIDCRIDSYGLEYLTFHEKLLDSDSLLQEFVQRYDVRYMLVQRSELSRAIDRKTWREDRWTVVVMDKSVAFLRRADL